jgi:hypothetical protein
MKAIRSMAKAMVKAILGVQETKLQELATRAWQKHGWKIDAGPRGGTLEIHALRDHPQPPPQWLVEALHAACGLGVEASTNQAIQTAHDATRHCRERAHDIMETVLSKAMVTENIELIRMIEDACAELRGELRTHDLSPLIREALGNLARRITPEEIQQSDGESRTLAKRRELINVAIGAELDAVGIGLDLERRRWTGHDEARTEPDDSYRWRLLERLVG